MGNHIVFVLKNLFLFLIFFALSALLLAQDNLAPLPSAQEQDNKWVAPPPVDENGRTVKYLIQAAFQQDKDLDGQAFSILDLNAKRKLDENSILAEGLVRLRKNLSTSDAASELDLRLARISYLESWIQVSVGRFDLFQALTPNLFFGGFPLMGIHRVDGVLATIPFSFLFKVGDTKDENPRSSPPLSASFFYTPSLFSAQQVQYDLTQAFWLSQIRFRLTGEDFGFTFRANAGQSSSNFFDYSSLNGGWTGSISAELAYQKNYSLTAEYGVQNINRFSETGALALGFQAARLGTWGAFSLDQIALEAQFPMAQSTSNAFTGGNGLNPPLAQLPKTCWYLKIKARLKIMFIEVHATNNQNDYTLARPSSSSVGIPFTGNFGPGNETDGPGTALRAKTYDDIAFLIRTGVEF